jgi:hypothetical protein
MYDQEREQLRKTYQLCRAGFGINAVALVLACLTSVVHLFRTFNGALVGWIVDAPWYHWIDTPIVWCSLIGTTLLWGRWNHTSWQRRAGLLMVMCLADIALWFLDRGDALGFHGMEMTSEWFRHNLGQALGWGEFALLSSLSCDYLVHLGVEHASDSDKSTRSMAVTGAMVWMLLFCQLTDWHAGWPLRPGRPHGLETLLLYHGSQLIWAITLIQVTALVISAAGQSSRVLAEMDREDEELDPLRSRSDANRDFELMTAYRDQGHAK